MVAGLALAACFPALAQQRAVSRGPEQLVEINRTALRAMRTDINNVKVLAEHNVAHGVVMRVVRDAEGRVYKQLEKDGKVSGAPESRRRPRRAAASNSFYEGFESYLTEGPASPWEDWIPAGWTEINTDAHKPDEYRIAGYINNTWKVGYTGDGYWTDITKDGECECFIHFTYESKYTGPDGEEVIYRNLPQDEWLISPEFTLQPKHKLFFDLELDEGTIYHYDWGTRTYDRTQIESTLEVLISDDNGNNWTPIWKATEEIADKKTDMELAEKISKLKYQPVVADIPERFAGKKVKLAFRYLNSAIVYTCGNSMAIDAIKVSAEMPEAFYNLPDNTLLGGLSKDFYASNVPVALYPCYGDIKWTDSSNSYTTSTEWTFVDANGKSEVKEGREVTVNYPYSNGETAPYPVLKAINSFGDHDFTFDGDLDAKGGIVYGGSVPDAKGVVYPVGNYDYAHGSVWGAYFGYANEGNYIYGISPKDAWGPGIVQLSSGNRFAKPASPFAVEEMMLTLSILDADPDAEIKLNIYNYDESGNLGSEPVATAVAKASDAVYEKEVGLYNLPFRFYDDDNNPAYYIYDTDMLVEITGYYDNDKIRGLAMCSQGVSKAEGQNTAYVRLSNLSVGYTAWYPVDEVLKNHYNSLYISMFGSYNFLRPEKSEVEFEQTTAIAVEAANSPDRWWVEAEGKRMPLSAPVTVDWLTVKASVVDGRYMLDMSASPTNVDREMGLVLATNGVTEKLVVKQLKTSGIEDAHASQIRVSFNNGMIVVSGAEAGMTVAIFAADGRLVAKRKVGNDGKLKTDISGFPEGVYVVRAGNRAVKICK